MSSSPIGHTGNDDVEGQCTGSDALSTDKGLKVQYQVVPPPFIGKLPLVDGRYIVPPHRIRLSKRQELLIALNSAVVVWVFFVALRKCFLGYTLNEPDCAGIFDVSRCYEPVIKFMPVSRPLMLAC